MTPPDGPLAGRRIVVTRAQAQAAPLAEALRALGADTLSFAAIRIERATDARPLHAALAALPEYDWLVLTSVNGVEAFWTALREAGRAPPDRLRICAVGTATAAAVERNGGRVDLVPSRHVAEAALDALLAAGVGAGTRVLLARAEAGRPVLPDGLRRAGAVVDDVPLYRTVPDGAGAEAVREALRLGRVDAITFTAGSTVRSFAQHVGVPPGRALTASIGPATSAQLRALGLPVDIEAEEHTIPGLVRALTERLSRGDDAA